MFNRITKLSATIGLLKNSLHESRISLRALSLPKRLKSSDSFKCSPETHFSNEGAQGNKTFTTGKLIQYKVSSLEKSIKELKAENEQLASLNTQLEERLKKKYNTLQIENKKLIKSNKAMMNQIKKLHKQLLTIQEYHITLNKSIRHSFNSSKDNLLDLIAKRLKSLDIELLKEESMTDSGILKSKQVNEKECQCEILESKKIYELGVELKRKEVEIGKRDVQITELRNMICEMKREREKKALEERRIIENLQKRLAEAESTDSKLIEKLNQIQIE